MQNRNLDMVSVRKTPDVHSYVVNKNVYDTFFPQITYCAVPKLTFIWHLMGILRSIFILLCDIWGFYIEFNIFT